MAGPENDRPEAGAEVPLLHRFIATGGFSGYAPWASGTVGSLVGILIYLVPGASSPPVLASLIILGFFAGRVSAARVAASTGHNLTTMARMTKNLFQPRKPGQPGEDGPPGGAGAASHPDPSIVVIDEIVGMWIALLFLPKTLPALLIAFTTFRVFDIVKPPPAAGLERVGNGWGIMLDDVVAGLYAAAATHATLWIIG